MSSVFGLPKMNLKCRLTVLTGPRLRSVYLCACMDEKRIFISEKLRSRIEQVVCISWNLKFATLPVFFLTHKHFCELSHWETEGFISPSTDKSVFGVTRTQTCLLLSCFPDAQQNFKTSKFTMKLLWFTFLFLSSGLKQWHKFTQ